MKGHASVVAITGRSLHVRPKDSSARYLVDRIQTTLPTASLVVVT